MRPRKVLTITTLVALTLFVYYATNAAPLISDSNYTYLSGMRWYKTYDEGAKVAKEEGKPIFLYFWTIWCVWCEKLQTEVYPQEEIAGILRKDFVLVAVDMDVNKEDARRFNVPYPPNEKFLTPDGRVIKELAGYAPPEEFYLVLKHARDSYYRGEYNKSG